MVVTVAVNGLMSMPLNMDLVGTELKVGFEL